MDGVVLVVITAAAASTHVVAAGHALLSALGGVARSEDAAHNGADGDEEGRCALSAEARRWRWLVGVAEPEGISGEKKIQTNAREALACASRTHS